MNAAELAGKKIAILGMGREGQAAYAWLQAKVADADLSLLAESPADPEFAAGMRANDRLLIEPLNAGRLLEFDVLVRSPGISLYREPLQAALRAGVRITSPSNLWFAAHAQARTICITGTKGKSTTSALLAHMLRAGGLEVRLAGNIGLPLLSCEDQGVDWWVIELSSYQLADLEAAPDIAVILNLSDEHLDWHLNAANYRHDKLRLARLSAQGVVVVNASDSGLTEHFSGAQNCCWFDSPDGIEVVGRHLVHQGKALPLSMPSGLPGHHNLLNAAAALTAVLQAGADLGAAISSVASFTPLPHRLQVLGKINGVRFINDSIASTPVSTLAALQALDGSSVILLLGGFDRGLDWNRHAAAFQQYEPKAIIGLPASGTRIIESLERGGVRPERGFHMAEDLASAITKAGQMAAAGDTVMLSPGAPSFPQFVDYQHRGQVFARLCGFNEAPSPE